MSNKAGTSAQAIALPTGGGALQGIGESFSPDLFTGTGNVTVPIELPPGRNGLAPQLALGYSTSNGNGPFGLGWSLSVPAITRRTSRGVPRYRDGAADPSRHDVFRLSGADDLVPVSVPEPGVTRFRPRTEGLFARIDRRRVGGEDVWRVSATDGLVNLFGARDPEGTDAAVVAHPVDRSKVFSWNLSQTTDPFGNRIEYRYLRDRGSERGRLWDQLYLREIRYVDVEEQGRTRFLVTVAFIYEERPDPFSDHRAGFEIRTRLRCRRIEVRTHADSDLLTRTYNLEYLDERVAAGELPPSALPPNAVSLLSRIRVVGHDADRREELPPLELGYTGFAPERQRFRSVEAVNDALPLRSLADDDFEMVALFSNGLPDIVQMNGAVQFWRNLGNGLFDAPRPMDEVPAGVRLRDPGVQFADMNGDGRADLLVLPQGGYFPLAFEGRWSRRGFVEYPTAPAVGFEDARTRLIDLDGDGVIDALTTAPDRFELFFNHPVRGWERTESRERGPLEEFPDLSFSDPAVKLADLTGDGLQDFVLVAPGRIDYWPYLGHGTWRRRVRTSLPDFAFPPEGEFDPRRVLLGDLDGDGLDDVVYVEPRRLTFWINQGGSRWSEPVSVEGTPPSTDLDAVRLEDLLGTGMAGVLWTFDQTAEPGGNYRFLDLTGGAKPYVLNLIDNHMGAVTRVQYTTSTTFYLADLDDPETRWSTPLPFPVQVVERVEVVDEISRGKLTTEYRYHHGYWDGTERELRGFGLVEQLDTERFECFNGPGGGDFDRVEEARFSPPLLTRTWFHLGPVGDPFDGRGEADLSSQYWPEDPSALERPAATLELLRSLPSSERAHCLRALRGLVLRTEVYALDGSEREDRPFTVTESQYGIREESPPAGGDGGRPRVFFPHPVAERTTQWERGRDPMTEFTFTGAYDPYGLPGREISLAVPRGRDFRVAAPAPGAPYLGTRTLTSYAQRDDADRYIVDRVAGTTTHEIVNDGRPSLLGLLSAVTQGQAGLAVSGQLLNYYDGAAFQGLPLGQLGDFGALVRSETLVLTEDLLRAASRSGDQSGGHAELPPYLVPGAAPSWTEEYPQEFRDRLLPLAGYEFSPGGPGHERGYFVNTVRQRYDLHGDSARRGRGNVVATRDPLGRETTVGYDRFELLPVEVVDPAGLTTRAEHDYRVLRAGLIANPNGNRTAFAFTPLGMLERSAVMGKEGEPVGDTLDAPGRRLVYDFLGFEKSPPDRRQPISVRTIHRVHHVNDAGVPAPERDEILEQIEYSDGFGRLIQTRTLADDVTFGDPSFGAEVLPAAPGDPGTQREVTGRRNGDSSRPNVVVSGWQVHDNKGRVVEKYEPFFATGRQYAPPASAQLGLRVTFSYDPRGHLVRTVDPDGSEQRVIYGVPLDLADPERFTPTPWEAYTYDANDNAGRSHPGEAGVYEHHWNTPASLAFDALGRTVVATERHRAPRAAPGDPPAPVRELRTRSTYDIRGNLVRAADPLDRFAFRYVYDLADRPLRVQSIDSGVRRTVLDAAGNEIERRAGNGAVVLHAYDALRRPIRRWARDEAASAVALRERLEYGDGGDPDQPAAERAASRAADRLGLLHKHYDEAGLLTFARYDFKGNILEKARQVIADEAILAVFPAADDPSPDWRVPPFRVDWQPPAGVSLEAHAGHLLEPVRHETAAAYDALSRVVSVRFPRDADGRRRQLRTSYNRAGALERASLDGQVFVERIAYSAAGQRTVVALGNGVLTRYAYHPRTARLVRLRSEQYTKAGALAYRPTGAPLQDLAYQHDLVGNIVGLVERTPGSGVRANPEAGLITDPELRARVAEGSALARRFTYDPLYRLVSATGRECAGGGPLEPWADGPRCGFDGADHATPNQGNAPSLTSVYGETYSYDDAGNLVRLRHTSGVGASARETSVRQLGLVPGANRLRTLAAGSTEFAYTYDANGNLTGEGTSRHFEWDHSDQMKAFRTQAGTSEPSIHAQFLYDAAGQRVKKLVRRQGGGVTTTVCIDGHFERHRWEPDGSGAGENSHLHLTDEDQRIALVRVGPPAPDDRGPAVQYHLGDHVGSSNLVVSEDGGVVNREEHLPYGGSSFGGFSKKRYRFTGRERDEESGLYYHGSRYYAPWLARWATSDPAGARDGLNLYSYARSNPLTFVDTDGTQAKKLQPKGILVHPASKLSADTLVKMIKENKDFPGFLKRRISREDRTIKMPKTAPKKPKGTFSAYLRPFHEAFKANEWQITTGEATIDVRRIKVTTLSGKVTEEVRFEEKIKPHLSKTERLGRWSQTGPNQRTFTPEPLVGENKQVVFGWTLDESFTKGLQSKRGLIVIVTKFTVRDPKGSGTREFTPTENEILESVMHEIAAHAGRISLGLPDQHPNRDVEDISEEVAKFFRFSTTALNNVGPWKTRTDIFKFLKLSTKPEPAVP